jgi:oligo-1,6-glucosidase
MPNAPWESVDQFRDLESVNHYADALAGGQDPAAALFGLRAMSRDNARTPVHWDATEHAGFTTGTPWLPVHPDFAAVNAAAQRDDPGSVLAHYRRLIELRHTEDVVAHGSFTMLLPEDRQVYAFLRRLGRVELLVLANLSGRPATVTLTEWPQWTAEPVLITNLPERAVDADVLVLEPWEARVHRRER